MWFKKKANISGFNPNTAVDGTDWRTNGNGNNWSVYYTLPSAADANNYFYVPALGYYDSGQLYYVGRYGYYWSSSAIPTYGDTAYGLGFTSSGGVRVGDNVGRDAGYRVEPTFK